MMTDAEYGATKLKIEQENEEKLKRFPVLQKQLEIAVEGLNQYAKPHNVNMYDGGYMISMGCRYLSDKGKMARKYLQRIEALNEIHKQE